MQVRFPLSAVLGVLFVFTLVFGVASPLLAQQGAPARVTQAVDNNVRTLLPGNVHPLARAEFDRGEAPADLLLKRMLLVLKRSPEQETALHSLLDDQQDKNSSSYHQWLTPEEFGARFGPADPDIAAVTNWLTASGFEVTQVSNGRTVIEFSGTAGLVKQAFGTAIHKFVVKGEEHWANLNDPSIPTALAPVVAGVDSLHNFLKKAQNKFVGTYSEKSKQLTSPQPEFTFNGGCTPDANNCFAVAPYDFATIYDLLPLWNASPTPINGTGQTIAIVGRTDIDPTDATTFWSLFGLDGVHAPQPTLVITPNGPNPGVNSDESEADIDVQWSGAAAPGSTINFVTSATTETTDGVDLSALYIVDKNLAPVMSESFGLCELGLGQGGVTFYGLLWEQAAAQGISAMVSTGDNGAAGCDDPNFPAQFGLNVNGIASTPFNVAVGGTDFNEFNKWSTYWNASNSPITQESAKGYIPETTWNDSCTNSLLQFLQGGTTNAETNCNNPNFAGFLDSTGGSGGTSLAWMKPSWQTGTPNDNSRDLPDVSLFASNGFLGSFYVICQKDATGGVCDLNNFAGFGGTSVASPAFAGIMALVNQKWGVQGNPNFVLYKLPAKQATAFHDVPSGSTIAMPCFTGSTSDCITQNQTHQFGVLSGFNTGTAYDLATGLGSVDANIMVNNWNKVTFTPSTTMLTLNGGTAVNVTHGTPVPVVISVTPASPTATGDVALLVSPGTPGNPGIDWFNLSNGGVNGSTNLLPGGTYKVIAHYEGDTTYGGSYSAPTANVTVNPENSSVFMPGVVVGTDVNNNPIYSNSVVYGTGASVAYLLRADVLNSQANFCTTETFGEIACPTGTVTFTDNGSPLDAGTYKLNSFGYTEDQVIQLTGGSHTLVGNYSGDASYKSSTSGNTIVTVSKATTTINNVSAPGSAAPGQVFTVTATVSTVSAGVAPTGTVSFFANGTLLPGTVQLTPVNGGPSNNASLGASLNTSISASGNYSITATYSGDGNYANVAQSNAVAIGVFDFNVPATLTDPAAAEPGQSTTTNMLIAPVGGGTFTNNVTYQCSGLPAGASCSFVPTQINSGAAATTVTVTVQTAGPFMGIAGGARHKLLGQKQGLWLPLSLPLAGLVLVGLAGLGLPRRQKIVGMCLAIVLAGLVLSCGGSSNSGPPPVNVSVSPKTVNTLFPNLNMAPPQTQQFTANVAVTWAVVGGSSNGTIDANGLYSAPSAVPAGPVTVKATSTQDTTKSDSATVNIQTPTPSGVYPVTVTVSEGTLQHTTTFNLTVQTP